MLARILCGLVVQTPVPPDSIVLQGAKPTVQQGSVGEDRKAGSLYQAVLGKEWGSASGHFAEYTFTAPKTLSPARLRIRYAREIAGASTVEVSLDGQSAGIVKLPATGGWGDRAEHFAEATVALPNVTEGEHRLRLSVPTYRFPGEPKALQPVPVLDTVGNRADKNTVGHGNQVALYTGLPSRFFYATQNLTDVFSAVDGETLSWAPDHVLVTPQGNTASNVNVDRLVIEPGAGPDPAAEANGKIVEQRQVCVTKDDVVVSRIFITNTGERAVKHRVEVRGDCRGSADYRGRPGGEKATKREGSTVILTDKHVFPSVLKEGLTIAVGGNQEPAEVETDTPGAYRLAYDIDLVAGETRTLTLACAIDRDGVRARANLVRTLREEDPLEQNRQDWTAFYEGDVPSFTSSDKSLDELYAFRWFLLKFSQAGGDLGFLKYPVILEGRQAFQTYCCYSAPFMAFDMNWYADPQHGFGHIANSPYAAYEDGRFPWYTTPETNRVPLDHASATGQSAIPWTAWRFYQIHGRKDLIASVYDGMRANVDWWIKDRDPDGNGLFTIDHQLETGMDDLFRRWKGPKPKRYEAIDATAYAVLNLRGVANMARELGHTADAEKYGAYADKAAKAMQTILWDPKLERYRDRNPDNGELTDYNSLTIFYPMFAGVADPENLSVIRRYLLDPKEYATPWPVPAISQSDPEFDTEKRYWAGPTWPATNSHVFEGFAITAKRLDRSLLPQVSELFKKIVALHMRPRADFYEHYNSLTGAPMSDFRDYMHSWWVDLYVRHVAGLNPQDDGSLVIDPLPLGLKTYALRGAPFRGHRVDVLWNDEKEGPGLTVRLDGKVLRHDEAFQPGGTPITIPATELTNLR
jgi:hypothetical protein